MINNQKINITVICGEINLIFFLKNVENTQLICLRLNENIQERAAEILYDRFYNQAEEALVNQYESEADTE